MRNAKKTLSLVMVAIFTTFIVLSGIPAGAVTTAQAKAQVTKATAAVVKVEKTVKVATFNPTTAQTQLTAATKEVAKVKSLGKTYTKTYTALAARNAAVAKKIAARKAAIAKIAAQLAKLYSDANKAVEAAEKATDADVDLVADAAALAEAQGAVTAALEFIVKLDKNSSNYKGLMARIDAANNVIVDAMEEIAKAEADAAAAAAAEAEAKAAAEALKVAVAAAETAVAAAEKAPLVTAADATSAKELSKAAATAVAAVKDAEAAAPFSVRVKAVDAKIADLEKALIPATITVAAAEEAITVTFSKATTAAAADFVITKAIGNAAATTVAALSVTQVSELVSTIKVPATAATAAEQSVVYTVAYKGQTAAVAVAYKVPAMAITVAAKDSKTLDVTFSQELTAAEKAVATFVVNYTNSPIAVNAPVWNGKVASFTRLDAAKLAAGSYSVTVNGLAAAVTGTATVAAEKLTKIELSTVRVSAAANQTIEYKAYNQYNEAMTVAAGLLTFSTNNTTNVARVATVAAGTNTGNFAATSVGDVVRVNVQVTADPSINATGLVTVSNIVPTTATLADPVLPTGATRFVTGLAGIKVTPTVADNFGTAVKLTAGAVASGATVDNFIVTYSNINTVTVDADGKFDFTLGAAGTASISMTSIATGAVTTKIFTVYATPDTATISLTAPTGTIRVGTNKAVTFAVKDQYGNAIAVPSAAWATTDVVLGSTNPAVAEFVWNGNALEVNPKTAGTCTLYVTVSTSVADPAASIATLQVTVAAPAAPSLISVSGTPTTSLAIGQTVLGTATAGALKFKITDQDGNAVNLAATGAVGVKANLTVTNSVANVLTAPTNTVLMAANMSATAGTTNGITVTAGAKGTSTISVQLFNDLNNNDVLDSGEALASTATVTYTVADPVLTKGSYAVAGAGVVASTDKSYAYAASTGALTYTYNLLDQAGNALTTTADVVVNWTIVNNSADAITVNDGTAKTLAAGATGTYTTTAAAGAAAKATIIITGAKEGKVSVTAAATGVATQITSAIYLTDTLIAGNDLSYNGTIVGVDTTGHSIVINTAIGYVVLADYTGAAYRVDGNTTTQAKFDDAVTVNDTVVITTNGTGAVTIALTNK